MIQSNEGAFRVAVKLTDKQREFLAMVKGAASRLLFPGGARSGKTFFILYIMVWRAIKYPLSRHLICRHRFNAAKASIWMDSLRKVLACFPNELYGLNETDHIVVFKNGSEIWVDGLDEKDRVDKILGREYVTIYFNECSQIRYSTVEVVKSRLAQKIPGCRAKLFFDLNPSGKGHWTYKLWIEHTDPITGDALDRAELYDCIFSTPNDNRDNVDADYIKDVLEGMTGARRRRFLDGLYSDDDGNLVFPIGRGTTYNWADFTDWAAGKSEDLRCTAGLDLGFEDADAFVAIIYTEADPTRWLVYEAKERKQGMESLAGMVKAGLDFLAEHKLPKPPYIYTDSGGGGKRTMVDLSSVYGLPTMPAYKSDKQSGILMLQEDLRSGALRIPAAGILYHEAQRTVWAEDDDTGKRVIDDSQYHPDLVDAVLYAMRYLWYYFTKK